MDPTGDPLTGESEGESGGDASRGESGGESKSESPSSSRSAGGNVGVVMLKVASLESMNALMFSSEEFWLDMIDWCELRLNS